MTRIKIYSKFVITITMLTLLIPKNIEAQTFLNPELKGLVGSGQLPTSWQAVPDTDPNSIASNAFTATPDVTDLLGPDAADGQIGNPLADTTFASALKSFVTPLFFHEGIMQTVSGFTPGDSYTIYFNQTVVKQQNSIDTSGSWSVYFDNTLIGTSAPTVSKLAFNSTALVWEARNVTFTATAATHTIKFLVEDDDANITASTTDSAGALRMGIDAITFTTPLPIELLNFSVISIDYKHIQLDWQTTSEINNDFYTIERSIDAINWETLTKREGAGNSSSLLNYTLIDHSPYAGLSYYRLKQTDFDGQYSYSEIKSINFFERGNTQILIYPNPTDKLISIKAKAEELKEVKIYNILGENVTKKTLSLKNTESELVIDLTKLSNGIYYIKTKTVINKFYKK